MATLTETFTNIANSIRLKTETTDKITPENMPAMIEGITTGGNVAELSITSNGTYRAPEGIDGYTPVIVNVPQDGAPPAEALVITGGCSYRFANNGWNWFIDKYSNQITTKDINNIENMFYASKALVNIPFEINCKTTVSTSAAYVFRNCEKLENAPMINNLKPSNLSYFFQYCYRLRTIPDNFGSNWDWSYLEGLTSGYSGSMCNMFENCYSLRKIPQELISHTNPVITYSYSLYRSGFKNCYVLDEIVDLVVPDNVEWTSNVFLNSIYDGTFHGCNRLKRLTFATNEDGTPKIAKWKNQIIDLGRGSNGARIGYCYDGTTITTYNSGLTTDTRIYNNETYQQLKDNPDSWTDNSFYSRYNKISAIETINSLPDTSAYLASSGGTNTIIFGINNGLYTDGGAINTMTEEEIAVATAKGWTVSFG